MVIGFDAKRLLHNRTGLGNYARNLLSSLLEAAPQNEYHLFSPEAAAFPPEWNQRNHPALVYHHPQAARLARGIRNSLWRTYGIARLAAQSGVQLYHGLSHELPNGLKRHRMCSIVTIHDLIFLRHPEWFPFADRFFYRQKVLRACQQADLIVAISECTAHDIQDLLKIPRERIKVIYQSVSTVFQPGDHSPTAANNALPDSYILAVGNCDARKNYQTVLQAYAQLPDDRPHLVLTGPYGNERRKIDAQIRANKLTESIIWQQPSGAESLAQLYRGARFSVYLSRYEGFGLPVLESIACGTPVLAANGSSLEEAGGNAATYVRANDAEAASMVMRRLLYDDTFHQRQAQLCSAWATRFSPESRAQTWLDVYGRFIGSTP